MRIVVHNAARVWGGNEKWAFLLADGLRRRGHHVVISCRPGSIVERRCRDAGLDTTSHRPGAYLDVPRALDFAVFLRRLRADTVLLTSHKGMFTGAWAARRAGVKRVVARVGILTVPDTRRHALPFRRWIDALIVNAPEIRDAWLRHAPWFPPHRVHFIRNAVPMPDPDRAAARARLHALLRTADETPIIGGAGVVTRRKGFDLLIDALARTELADAAAVIVGDGPELPALRQRARAAGIEDRIHFLGARDDVPRILAGCDVFALTSRNEGMANVMLEAMAAGTPVVAADISGVRDAIAAADGAPPAGWIVPPEDPAALSAGLRQVLDLLAADDPAVHTRTAEARSRILRDFTPDRMISAAEAVLLGQGA